MHSSQPALRAPIYEGTRPAGEIEDFIAAFKAPCASPGADDWYDDPDIPLPAHLAPLYGAVCADFAAYSFLLNHAKMVLSAGVRAGVLGAYASQALLVR